MYQNNANGHDEKPPPPPSMQIAQYPPAGAAPGQWTTGLYGCCEDPSNCIITWCCPCISFRQNAKIIDGGATSCCVSGLIYYLLASVGIACLYTSGYRKKLRGLHLLQEDPCGDCLVHCFCLLCALCQEYRELKNRGFDPSIGWVANAEKMNQGAATMPPMMQGMGLCPFGANVSFARAYDGRS